MVLANEGIGIAIILAGAILFTIELFHPGALLMIPGTILLVGGILYVLIPDVLLDSIVGPFVVVFAAVIATVGTIFYYRWLAGSHKTLTTNPPGLVGEEGLVIADVVPDTLRGKVRIGSEIWSARGSSRIPAGTRVRIVHGEGVSVTVEPVNAAPPPPSS